MPRRHASRSHQKKIASQRISKLLSEARAELAKRPERSARYVHLARTIAMRCKVRIPRQWSRMICKRCDGLLIPGKTCRVRLRSSRLNITCTRCGMVYRYPYERRVT